MSAVEPPVDVVVAIPAHNEQRLIRRCLESVMISAGHATDSGAARRILIAAAAHRCTDRTADEALTCLASYPGPFMVTRDQHSTTVGAVRARLLTDVVERHTLQPLSWVLNTDADSEVPPTWIDELLTRASASDHPTAIAGLVELSGWSPSQGARRRYTDIIDAGIHDGTHDHVYGATLGVRWDAYQAVGSFHAVEHGEDHDLIE